MMSLKNLELDIYVGKMGNSMFFRDKQQILQKTANSAAWRKNLRAMEYCWPWWPDTHSVT